MRKKTLVILFTTGIVLIILAEVSLLWAAPLSQCNDTAGECSIFAILEIVLGVLFFFSGWVLCFIAYIGMMIKQAKRQQWGWFVCTLLFGLITMLIYLIAVPEEQLAIRPYKIDGPSIWQ